MTAEEKNRFDALAEWRRSEFERIHERRDGEWKCTLAFWGGFGALGLSLAAPTDKPSIVASANIALLIFAAALALALHATFLHGVAKRHHDNRRYAYFVTTEMASLLCVFCPAPPRYEFLDWSRGIQFGISALLAVAFIGLRVLAELAA